MSRDIRGGDLVIAITVAVTVVLVAGVALSAPALEKGRAPEVDVGIGIPIAVTPVLDTPAGPKGSGGRGGKPKPRKVPKAWQRRQPPKTVENLPPPPPDAPEPPPETPSPSAAPIESLPKPPTAPELPGVVDDKASEDPTPPESEPEPETPAPEGADGGDGPGDGGGAPGTPEGEGDTPGAGGDGVDPVAARAIASYRERLIRWLSARFRVTGSGMSKAELLKYKVRATIRIGDDRTVTGFDLKPSGSAVFDRAAKEALESVRGEQVPRPPDDYPGALQSTVRMTFVCKESTCN